RAVVRRIADEFGAAFIPLHEESTQLASRFADPAHVLVDGVHPASAGAQLIADRLVAKIEEML
ncbi:MAG: hypothetical protein MJ025_05870, partial [Victivallaceae bacterium]|nr:hypothetical protein [Victivallaceae bacterium]